MKKLVKALIASTLGLAAPLLAQVTLSVSAHMDIYRAGGYNDGSDGIAPVVYSFPARPFQTLTFSSVAGAWSCSGGVAEYGADGTSSSLCYHAGGQDINNPTGPFSGYDLTDFTGAMVGVFLEDALPTSAPPPLRFYVSDSSHGGTQTAFKALGPKIGQVFFIGDGLTGTGSGSIQVFGVPPTATHLYLGYIDSCIQPGPTVPSCFSDNAGTLSATLQIHALNWVSPSLSPTPPGTCCFGMAYDYATQSTVLFGGSADPPYLDDTWILRGHWSQVSPATSPPPRGGPGMAWDGAAGNIVLFGGVGDDGKYFNDTWTWDGVTWTQQLPLVSPPARAIEPQGMTYDAASKTVVLFGGLNSGRPCQPNGNALGDTWTWDGIAKTWTQQFPAVSPSARRAPMAYDAATRSVVLFGGDNGASVDYSDTWTWNGATWTQRFPAAAPLARQCGSVAYDGTLGAVVLFGGFAGSWPNSLDDTWAWNGADWVQAKPATVPPNRYSAGMTYVPAVKGLVMFGGLSSGPGRQDTWIFTLVPVSGANEK
jgi:hypothetical protein